MRRIFLVAVILFPLGASAAGARERVSASPRRKVRISLTTAQQGFRIGTARVRANGRFRFRWVPRRAKVGAGLWRLRARMRCESGKDGSAIFRRASMRFRIRR